MILKQFDLMFKLSATICIPVSQSGEVAQWLAPQICSVNREVGGSNLTVSTDDPLG